MASDTDALVRPSVLVVDDDEIYLRAVKRLLRRRFHVELCSGPTEALERLAAVPVDVVVSDWNMPGTDGGIDLLDVIRSKYPRVARVLASSAVVPELHHYLESGLVQRFVDKGAAHPVLVEAVEALVLERESATKGTE
jgi:CheY-like chemotaxis protein